MKKILTFAVFMICILTVLSSCSKSKSNDTDNPSLTSSLNTPETTCCTTDITSITTSAVYEEITYEDFFDTELTKQPTNEEINRIKEGMPLSSVIELIGKPHKIGPTSGVPSLDWITVEGKTITMTIIFDDRSDNVSIYDSLYKSGVVFSVFCLKDIAEQYNEQNKTNE